MSLIANVLGFGAFGFMTRTLQLGILKRQIFEGEYFHLSDRFPSDPYQGGCSSVEIVSHSISKPLFSLTGPHTHLATAAVFGLAGWGVYELEGVQ